MTIHKNPRSTQEGGGVAEWPLSARQFERVRRAHAGIGNRTELWVDLLRDCHRRGMTAPVLAIGDGALGFWKAVYEVFPDIREQRCWFRKRADVLAALPKSAHSGAIAAMRGRSITPRIPTRPPGGSGQPVRPANHQSWDTWRHSRVRRRLDCGLGLFKWRSWYAHGPFRTLN